MPSTPNAATGLASKRAREYFETVLPSREMFAGLRLLPHHWIALTYALLATYLILIVRTFLDYGITWDEWGA